MKKKEVDEILEHINQKFEGDVPRIVKMLIRKKIGKFQEFEIESLPESLRTCTIEELVDIVKKGLESGKLKI
ncbi:hypothetical protein AAA799B03_00493 [Marine Group I thaumarchaeote SCGC AAA799-B03]|uniref:Uncharacterized protein n=1 Tax=Marine Group I thaumarchaeote SCGC AAA799-B03 TaxID=1502289 RepID=A0A087S7V8_9ARCH|nr:hypothetical protein AAA799B03_00493 [Marine Group I thaumarchaeote SCGC AAA799-B03]